MQRSNSEPDFTELRLIADQIEANDSDSHREFTHDYLLRPGHIELAEEDGGPVYTENICATGKAPNAFDETKAQEFVQPIPDPDSSSLNDKSEHLLDHKADSSSLAPKHSIVHLEADLNQQKFQKPRVTFGKVAETLDGPTRLNNIGHASSPNFFDAPGDCPQIVTRTAPRQPNGIEPRPDDTEFTKALFGQVGKGHSASKKVSKSVGTGGVRHRLKCIEIKSNGDIQEQNISRSEILQEARAALPACAPSPKSVWEWLSNADTALPDLQEFSERFGLRRSSKKAMQRALRNYLRNSLQPRDIRQVDPAFTAKPALWVRYSAIVVSLEGIRAIILHDKVLLFDLNHPMTRTAAAVVRQSVTVSPELLEDPHLPFEFKALEGMFIVGILGLESEFNAMKPEIDEHLHELQHDLSPKMLEELRLYKQRLHHFMARASRVRELLEKLLNNDEDMSNMYLSEKFASPAQERSIDRHDEVEMMLEAYMQVIDELVNRVGLLKNAIEDTEDVVLIHLDTLRNRLLSADLVLNIYTMCFTLGGAISSLFGMNLSIPLYDTSPGNFSFLVVVLVIAALVVGFPWISLHSLRRKGLVSFT